MAVVLYRQGTTHEENGVKCEMQVVNEYSFMHLLEDGWFFSPEEAYSSEEENEVVRESTESEIREAAKAAGIKSWHNKGIDKLIAELEEHDNQS